MLPLSPASVGFTTLLAAPPHLPHPHPLTLTLTLTVTLPLSQPLVVGYFLCRSHYKFNQWRKDRAKAKYIKAKGRLESM